MQLDIYAQETNLLTEKNASLLDEVKQRLKKGELLSNLEQAGTLHALQVLIENAIGKAKHTLKFLALSALRKNSAFASHILGDPKTPSNVANYYKLTPY